MESELLKTARREAESLRAELAKNPAFQKLQQVQRLIDVYEAYEGKQPPLESAKVAAQSPKMVPPTRPGTKLAQVEKIVLDYSWKTGQRHSSGQLMPILTDAGIEMAGKVPSKTLASMLSNSQKLNNLRGYGYGPAEWGDKLSMKDEKNEAPTVEPASASQITGGEAQSSLLNMGSGND
jgi:hypothetical protein